MAKYIILIIFVSSFFSCKENSRISNPIKTIEFDDHNYIVNTEFIKGDVRRYGLLPNKVQVKPTILKTIIELADKGVELYFPKGFYNTSLIIQNKQNLVFKFDDAEFSGSIQIVDDSKKNRSDNIILKGKVTTYDKFFTRNSQNITIENLVIKTDTIRNIKKEESLGCSIYAGSKHITIDTLIIDGLGSKSKYYQHSAAALQLHGWNNNPENVTVNHLEIKSSDRHGAYITGTNHKFNSVKIQKFGLGSNKDIFPLGDAKDDEVKTFSGLWINRCNDCEFNNVEINTNNSLGDYSLKLDEGQAYNPSFIYNLKLIESKNKLSILDDYLTNILVKKVERY